MTKNRSMHAKDVHGAKGGKNTHTSDSRERYCINQKCRLYYYVYKDTASRCPLCHQCRVSYASKKKRRKKEW